MARKPMGATRKQPAQTGQWWQRLAAGLRYCGYMLSLAVLLAGVGISGDWLLTKLDQPIAGVQVQGQLQQLNAVEVEQYVGDLLQPTYLQLDLDAIRERLESHPWVARSAVRRQWPDQIVLQVTERQAFAQWGQDQLVTANGVRFQPPVLPTELALQLIGPTDSEAELLEWYPRLRDAMAASGLDISRLEKNQRGSWSVAVQQGFVLYLGRDDLLIKLERLQPIYNQMLVEHSGQIAAIDLRYTNGIAVQWRASDQAAIADPFNNHTNRMAGSQPCSNKAFDRETACRV